MGLHLLLLFAAFGGSLLIEVHTYLALGPTQCLGIPVIRHYKNGTCSESILNGAVKIDVLNDTTAIYTPGKNCSYLYDDESQPWTNGYCYVENPIGSQKMKWPTRRNVRRQQ